MKVFSFLFFFSHEPWLLPPSLELIYALKKSGFHVDVLYAHKGVMSDNLNDFLIDHVYYFPDGRNGLFGRIRFPLRLKKEVNKALNRGKYDVVIACDIAALQILSKTRFAGYKKVYWAFELNGIERKLNFSWDSYRCFSFSRFLRKMNLIIVPSDERKDIISRLSGSVNCIVIGNFRANRFVEAMQIQHDPRQLIELIFAGKISFASGIHEIIENVVRFPNLRLTLVGRLDCDFKKWFSTQRFENIVYKGMIENNKLVPFLKNFDVSVCAYSKERPVSVEAQNPAPTKAGDAIAAGCILLCSDHPYLKSLVGNNELGYCFDANDLEHVISQIASLSRPQIEEFRQKLKRAFVEKFCMEVKVDLLLKELFSI